MNRLVFKMSILLLCTMPDFVNAGPREILMELRKLGVEDAGLDDASPFILRFQRSAATDADMYALCELPTLYLIDMSGCKVPIPVMRTIGQLSQIQELRLTESSVTDSGLAELRSCARLRSIILDGTNITDAGLNELVRLKKLRELHLSNTRVTESGIRDFQKAVPGCKVFH